MSSQYISYFLYNIHIWYIYICVYINTNIYIKWMWLLINTYMYVYIDILGVITYPCWVWIESMLVKWSQSQVSLNTLRPRQNGRHFADDIFRCIFLNEDVWIALKISLKFVPRVRINNIPALVQIMAWRRPGDKPLSEPMMVSLSTHICVTRPQWVNLSSSQNHETFRCWLQRVY